MIEGEIREDIPRQESLGYKRREELEKFIHAFWGVNEEPNNLSELRGEGDQTESS